MIISVNWLKKFTAIDLPIDELATLIGARLVEIEEVIDLGKKYEGVVVARVVECVKLEGSDHLNVAKIDDGGVIDDIERDSNGYVQVVCGAPNVREDLLVAWLPPSSTVPETYADAEPFVLSARKLRGVMSNGMLASAKELDLFDVHDGILEVDQEVVPGARFADVYELNDFLLDIENKSLTHRPDTFGIIGFAREVAAIQGNAFTTPDWLLDTSPNFVEKNGDVTPPTVTIDDPLLSERYQAVVLAGADGSMKSPLEIQTYLSRVGVRPVSAVVDVTNYLMMLTGQPLHAFDYDKLLAVGGGKADIHVRAGKDGETLELLDGRTITLSDNDIVIANADTAIALAGAMGGSSTEIDSTTKNIILESATFNLYNLRNTQMRHGIFSEAITRFTKGQPAALTAPVLASAVRLLAASTGATRVSEVADTLKTLRSSDPIELTVSQVNAALGSKFSAADIVDTLQHTEFDVTVNEDTHTMNVVPPFWRSDIHIGEDIIEEVGRLNGFDSIEPKLPLRDFTAVSPDAFDKTRAALRRALVRAGANEVLSYSFVHGDILKKAGQNPENSYRITNSISPDLQYYRQTLTPSLLSLVRQNEKNGFDDFALFEMNKTHSKAHGLNDEKVPGEIDFLALTVVRKKASDDAAFYQAKKYLEYLAGSFGLELRYDPVANDVEYPVTAPFEYRRSALVTDVRSGEFIGVVGEYKKSVAKAFKLPVYSAGFEIDPRAILAATAKNGFDYTPISRYPSSERDVCFKVDDAVNYAQIVTSAQQALQNDSSVQYQISPLDLYQAADESTKNITIRVRLTPFTETLTGQQVSEYIDGVIAAVTKETGATVV